MPGLRMALSLVVVGCFLVVGCGKKEEPNPQPEERTSENRNGPSTLAEAVTALKKQRDELASGYAAGDVKKADTALHGLLRSAKSIADLGTQAKLDRYDLSDATTAADQITEILSTLHDSMGGHGADAKVDAADYDKEADSLNDAINNIETITLKASAAE